MKNPKDLHFEPSVLECDGERLFEGEESRSYADKTDEPNFWITNRYVTEDGKVTNLEITTFKGKLPMQFYEDLAKLVNKYCKQF